MHTHFFDFLKNVCFWAPFLAWLTAQLVKMAIAFFSTRRFDFGYLVSTGGMPSAHSAMSSALATSVGLVAGWHTPVFCVSLAFALLVMFDAATVRRAAGQQARLLNQLIDQFFKEHKLSEKKLAELLGHTRLEVLMGMIVGILVAIITCSVAELR